ncbi:hypothetical protein [Limnothrix sp. PR1529]|uniref:hypothetical protein n=1 Tax=Limnothrix sp. PR1529 TaxID=1704291 RepID=UPI000A49080C|nr:hypothetical protein [Limnothrix sp. PR1529]
MAEDNPPLLPLQNMADRHQALTPAVASSYLEAARVCLDRHHISPKEFTLGDDQAESVAKVEWEITDSRVQAAWANVDDATRDGAYAVAIAATELLRGMVAVRRAETRTGADYYIASSDQDLEDLEGCFRLEVSGTHSGKSEVKKRLRIKLEQARQGNSNLPALAAVIGFRVQLILLQTVDEKS